MAVGPDEVAGRQSVGRRVAAGDLAGRRQDLRARRQRAEKPALPRGRPAPRARPPEPPAVPPLRADVRIPE